MCLVSYLFLCAVHHLVCVLFATSGTRALFALLLGFPFGFGWLLLGVSRSFLFCNLGHRLGTFNGSRFSRGLLNRCRCGLDFLFVVLWLNFLLVLVSFFLISGLLCFLFKLLCSLGSFTLGALLCLLALPLLLLGESLSFQNCHLCLLLLTGQTLLFKFLLALFLETFAFLEFDLFALKGILLLPRLSRLPFVLFET